MKIVACYKLVPEETQISFKANGTPDLSACEWQIGQYDLSAIEAAARIAEKNEDCHLIALTAGGDIVENSKLKKSVLSRGPEEMVAVKDAKLAAADSFATASVLAEAIQKIGDVSLVVFGEGSADVYAQQVGPMVGAILGWNTVNAVSSLELRCSLVYYVVKHTLAQFLACSAGKTSPDRGFPCLYPFSFDAFR